MNKLIKKIIFIVIIVILLFACKHSEEVTEIIETTHVEQKKVVIEDIDISDIENEAERNTLLRIDNLNHILGEDVYVSKEDFYKYKDVNVSLIGDSIADGAKGAITKYFRKIFIDSVPGREIKKVFEVYNVLSIYKKLGDIVIISLGTNASEGIDIKMLEKVYERLEGRPMFLLSIVIPYKGQERNRNRDINGFVDSHENCYLIDYHKVMKKHTEYFNDDKIHPNGAGSEVYAQLLYKSICDYLKEKQ